MRARRPEVELLLFDEPVRTRLRPFPNPSVPSRAPRPVGSPSAPFQTSSLDAHAQKHVFDTIEHIARPNGDRRKTVIYITHRLATARRADKIAMMESGVSQKLDLYCCLLFRAHEARAPMQTVVEFGTHEELLGREGKYAALYHASV